MNHEEQGDETIDNQNIKQKESDQRGNQMKILEGVR